MRTQTENLGSICACHGHKLVVVHFPRGHSPVPDDRRALLHTVGALGSGCEVVLPDAF